MELHADDVPPADSGVERDAVLRTGQHVGGIVRPYAEGNLTVAFDDSGRSFAAYDVQYLPFGVLVSAKGRALWMGNPRQLTEAILDSNL